MSKPSKNADSDLLARLAETKKEVEVLELKPEENAEERITSKRDLEQARKAKQEERAHPEAMKREEDRKRREEVNAAEFLSQPLPNVVLMGTPMSTTSSLPPKKTFEHFMPYVTQLWDQFETEMEMLRMSVANRIVKRPVEQIIQHTVFDNERLFELFWGSFREATLNVMKELFPVSPLAHGMCTTANNSPGCPDELFTVRGPRHIFTQEQRHPAVKFQTDRTIPDILREKDEPDTQSKTSNRYTVCTFVQSYTYMIQLTLKYGLISNRDHWVFMKREINDEGKEVLYVSPWIGLDRARLGYATLVFLASRDMDAKECHEVGNFGKVPTWIRSRTEPSSRSSNTGGGGGMERNADDHDAIRAARQTEPSRNIDEGGGSNSSIGGGRGINRRGAGDHDAVRAAYPETTTLEALGVTALSLLKSYQVLGFTEKAQTRRVQVNGRDLVVKLVDYLGVPKHSDFSAEDLNEFEWNEVRVYHYLQQQSAQGRFAPNFLYHGSDFNQIWAASVTTYEGESLATLLERDGSLTQAVKTAAVNALRELHELGVIHGDGALRNVVDGDVALRNAVWRPSDGKVIWVDYENASLRSDCPGSFEREALTEIRVLEAVLQKTPNPPAASASPSSLSQQLPNPPAASASPSSLSQQPPSQVVSTDDKREPTAKRICPGL